MNTAFRQDTRAGRLVMEAKLPLALVAFRGAEHMSALFEYDVECLAPVPDVDFDAALGTHATVILHAHDGAEIPFDGIVTEARWLGPGDNGHRYRLRLAPWFWLATQRRNQRIFHDKTAPQILAELLGHYADAGPLEDRLKDAYPVLEYTVQHRETDFAFASRLMERHGISYHFEHSELAHVMVLTDQVEDHADIGARPFRPYDGHHREEIEHFWDWQPARRVTTGAIALTDYNFKTPSAAMLAEKTGDAEHAQGQIESFDWPGDHLDLDRGRLVASLRTEAERGQDARFRAEGDIVALRAGARVTLSGDPVPGTGGGFLCLSAVHTYAANSYGSGGDTGDGYAHTGAYTLLPDTAPMRPELKTPLSLAPGPQTARVVGEGEIDCDEYGRILVQFHWDLDAAWSMRCRVSQSWGGPGWGGMVIPRIGMEVIVEFLDGDPDRPIVTGCVYNGKNGVPYPLPEHKTRSTFRTKTHQGDGFNELRFEDEKGREEIYLHAQKDQNLHVENNRTLRVDNNEVQSVGNHRYSEVSQNQTQLIGGNLVTVVGGAEAQSLAGAKINAGANAVIDVGRQLGMPGLLNPLSGNMLTAVAKNQTSYIALSATTQIGRTMTTTVGTTYTLSVGASKSEQVQSASAETIGTSKLIHAGESFEVRVGKSRLRMQADGTILIEGVGITVKGADIKLEGSSSILGEAPLIGFN